MGKKKIKCWYCNRRLYDLGKNIDAYGTATSSLSGEDIEVLTHLCHKCKKLNSIVLND